MSGNPVIDLLGRRIRLGVIGGGGEGLIGPVHRIAARLDDCYEIVAGVLSSDPDKAAREAQRFGLPRSYPSVEAMLSAEAARDDRIDVVAIMTPNDTHVDYSVRALKAGFNVICDKPLANELEDARRLVSVAGTGSPLFCLTHNYSGYPMIREARAAIAAGELGRIHLLQVSYLQGNLGTLVEEQAGKMTSRLKWRLDPARGGTSHVMSDIGTHAHQLATYVTGDRVKSVLADVGAAIEGRSAHDTASVILRMANGARGTILASKAASGSDNRISIEVYGDKGGLRWEQANPNQLLIMRTGAPIETRFTGLASLHPLAKRAARLPAGHPEAFLEAFSNIYADFAHLIAAHIKGAEPDPLAAHIPGLADGVAGLEFIDACLTSTASGTWADCAGS